MENQRPENFSQCLKIEGPCVFISCRHHFIWANPHKFRLSDDELVDYLQTLNPQTACTLMFVYWHRSGARLREIGEVFKFSRERIRQIERDATKRLIKKIKNLPKMDKDFFQEILSPGEKDYSISYTKVVSFYKNRHRDRKNIYNDNPLAEARTNLG